MVRTLLLRGLLAGLCAGVIASAFAYVVGEPQIDQAIALEDELARVSGQPHEQELVGRDLQSTVGLLAGLSIYGVAVGGLFALGFAGLYGRVARLTPARTALCLAAVTFAAVVLVPFLKYPANPPGVGSETTIGTRTELYFAMVAISILAAVVSLRVGRLLARRSTTRNTLLGAIGVFVAIAVSAGLILPGVDEIPRGYPADTLWHFRLASLGVQLVLWTTLGLVFAFAAQRAMSQSSSAARAGVAQRA